MEPYRTGHAQLRHRRVSDRVARSVSNTVGKEEEMATTHEFPDDRVHFTWDAGNEPVLTIESGDSVVYETRDVSDNQITPDSTAEAIAALDWDRVYPLAGPVRVKGAEPGRAGDRDP
jgi:Acetamidase/Formamidase family